jgi:serine/threonine protein kinase
MQEDPLIGRKLANYSIEWLIGRGGMAEVYFGRDIKLNRPAAIKVIDTRFRNRPNDTARFLQEARLVASWRHEHILQIYYADDVTFPDLGQFFFFAMEYIDGQNLADVLAETVKQNGSVPLADVLKYGRAISAALDYAHARGVIHRDVKPANILVSTDGRVVLSDFGLALEEQQGSIGEVFGTAHYIAPEQARRSSNAVPQSDLYSLGVILYEMLTGKVPFDDPSPTSVALQHITLPPPRPREINPNLSEEVELVLLKMLAKKPADRYASGAELFYALENALIHLDPLATTRIKIPPVPAQGQEIPPGSSPSSDPVNNRSSTRSAVVKKTAIGIGALGLLACVLVFVTLWVWQNGVTAAKQNQPSLAANLPQVDPSHTPQPATPTPFIASLQPTLQPVPATLPALSPTPNTVVTNSPAAQPTPSWTPKYASGRKMILSWNDSSFYLLQVSGYGELIAPLVFERLDTQGIPTNRFSGKLWAEFHPSTMRDWCMRLEIGGPSQPAGLPAFLRPAPCEEHYLAARWPVPNDPTIFWTHQEGSQQFRVLWGRDEIQRCQIDSGTCEVYLP